MKSIVQEILEAVVRIKSVSIDLDELGGLKKLVRLDDVLKTIHGFELPKKRSVCENINDVLAASWESGEYLASPPPHPMFRIAKYIVLPLAQKDLLRKELRIADDVDYLPHTYYNAFTKKDLKILFSASGNIDDIPYLLY